tara:strand:+ start:25 stop:723 length:699 start_codon:yes stop_codon:yes gene_type:complete
MSLLKAAVKSAAKKSIKRDPRTVAKKIQREKAVDLGTPTGVDETKVLKGQSQATDQANMVRVGRAKAGKQSKGVTKEYKATEKRLKSNQEKRNKLASSLKAYKGKNPPIQKQIADLDETIARQKNKLADMKKKNLIRRKGGGDLKPVDAEKNPGLSKLPTPVRNRMGFAKKGKQVSEAMGEDRTSVPSEYSAKAQSKKKKKMGGGKVYKRKHSGKVIKNNMSGQDLVNACYD